MASVPEALHRHHRNTCYVPLWLMEYLPWRPHSCTLILHKAVSASDKWQAPNPLGISWLLCSLDRNNLTYHMKPANKSTGSHGTSGDNRPWAVSEKLRDDEQDICAPCPRKKSFTSWGCAGKWDGKVNGKRPNLHILVGESRAAEGRRLKGHPWCPKGSIISPERLPLSTQRGRWAREMQSIYRAAWPYSLKIKINILFLHILIPLIIFSRVG